MRGRTTCVLAICLFLAIIIRAFIFLNTDHLDFESVFRIRDSYQFAGNPLKLLWGTEIIHSGTGCQKGYYFLNSLLMSFIDRPVEICKITSFVFGVFSIIAYYFLIKLCFSRGIALLSAFMLSFYPLHVQLSVVPMGNIGCIFFVILSLYFLMKYLYEQDIGVRRVYFLSSLIFTILATSFRIESWILIVLYPLFILREKRLKDCVLFFIFSAIYVASLFYLFYKQDGNPLFFLRNPVFSTPEFTGDHFTFIAKRPEVILYVRYKIFLWIKVLVMTFSLPLTILAFLGMFRALKNNNKIHRKILLFFWIFFIFSTLRYIITEHVFLKRYSIIMGIFFIPFIFTGAIYAVNLFLSFIRAGYPLRKTAIISCVLLINLYYGFFSTNLLIKEIPDMKYDAAVYKLADLIKKRVVSGDLVFSSFNTLHLSAAELINKFAEIERIDKAGLEKEKFDKISFFSNRFNSIPRENGIYCTILFKKGETKKPNRLVFILDDRDYIYLKDNLPSLFRKLDITKEGDFAYTGILSLDQV